MALSNRRLAALAVAALLITGLVAGLLFWPRPAWSQADLAMLRSLWLGSLQPLPPDPSNRYADEADAVALGRRLFFDTRFSANGEVSCATCHKPDLGLQDGIPLANGVGTTNRRTMPLAGIAYSPFLFWDGRKDSLWAQALGPLESPVEHGGSRTQYAHLIAAHYRTEYETLFGPLPDLSGLPSSAGPVAEPAARAAWDAMTEDQRDSVNRIYANMGKAIAAFERRLMPAASRFDAYVDAALRGDEETAAAILTPDERAGLRLFTGKANCTQCHNGPLLTDSHFHNTGVPAAPDLPEDTGRAAGTRELLADEFNCLGIYSDAPPQACTELRFMMAEGEELLRAFKPPSLRGVAERAPYMHTGQFATLAAVLDHYNRAPEAPAGHSELDPLNLSQEELLQLEAFLRTLSAPLTPEAEQLVVAP